MTENDGITEDQYMDQDWVDLVNGVHNEHGQNDQQIPPVIVVDEVEKTDFELLKAVDDRPTKKVQPTKENAILLLTQIGLHIEQLNMCSNTRDRAKAAALMMAQFGWKVLAYRANSKKFRQSFFDLKRLNAELGLKL